ncbi:MAG: FG-GAP-like repeat-containing protein [Polyangiales bacterium]
MTERVSSASNRSTRVVSPWWLVVATASACTVPNYQFDAAIRTDATAWQCGNNPTGVDLRSDPNNCGGCGVVCVGGANRSTRCENFVCVSQCMEGFGDCDGNASNGCEVNLRGDVANCGSCGTTCTAAMGAMARCDNGMCSQGCPDGFADCDGNSSNGCETDVRTSVDHCGACGTVCSAGANGVRSCVAGTCRSTCATGFGDCDSNMANGCETDLRTSATNCGMCGTRCTAMQVCAAGACAMPCPNAGEARCPAGAMGELQCVDPQSDLDHCGVCGNRCMAGANSVPTCAMGSCGVRCDADFGNCDGAPTNGCEVNLQTSAAHCGGCGMACPARANASVVCSGGACALGACNANFANCDGNATNGCEVNTSNTAAHCGGCGRNCALPNATPACVSGACAVASCSAGFLNCDMMAANGCETNASSDVNNCGACGNRCGMGQVCNNRTCTSACTAPTSTNCSGACVDTNTDVRHCGGCGRACSIANGSASCAAGVCGVGSCNAGFGNCDAMAANGCETNTSTSAMHCGACGRACAAVANATVACSAGTCTFTCNAGFTQMGSACVAIAAPRLIGPGNGHVANHRRPLFRVARGAPSDSVEIELSRTANFAAVDVRLSGVDSAAPTTDLAPGVYFWRARGKVAMNTGTTYSRVWSVVIPTANPVSAVSTSWLMGGDVNGDGRSDLLVGAPLSNSAYVYFGNMGTTMTALARPAGSNGFGTSIAPAGDVNGDGIGDVIVGSCYVVGGPAPRGTPPTELQCSGHAYIFHGQAGTAAPVLAATLGGTAAHASAYFGFSVGPAGDVNGDGYADVIVGAFNANFVEVFYGSSSGVSPTTPTRITGTAATDFGVSVWTAGDVNNDRYADIIVGAPQFFSAPGTAPVFLGRSTGISTTPNTTIADAMPHHYGLSVMLAGDVNADGASDVIVGGNASGGVVGLHHSVGGRVQLGSLRTWGGVAGTGFGASVAGVGDVNADGFDDVVIGSPTANRVEVFRGSATSPEATAIAAWTFTANMGATAGPFGRYVAPVGWLTTDTFADFVIGACSSTTSCTNYVRIVHGGASGPSINADINAPSGAMGFGRGANR